MGSVDSCRKISGSGTPESAWEPWLQKVLLPKHKTHHFLSAGRRLVVAAPHPDDEVLACGGLLAMHAAMGGNSIVIAVTDGERSHMNVSGWNPHILALTRRAEHLKAIRRLGLSEASITRIGLPDGNVKAHARILEAALVTLLRADDCVISTWRLDGHPDHEATARAVANACSSAGSSLIEAPAWMWHWAVPGDARVPWHRMVALPIELNAWKRKQRALAAHASQLTPRSVKQGPVLESQIRKRARRRFEYFFC
jgi:LmbE family N-acetylglucosaminyl deacetylase